MTPKERVYARLAGLPVDKIPNMNIAMGLVAKLAGVSYSRYAQDYRKLAEGNLLCAERFGFDTVSAISDPMREAAAFGATVEFPENGVPFSRIPLLRDPVDLSALQKVDPLDHPRTLDRIRGVELLHEKAGQDYPVIGWVEGVLAELADLRGVNELMMDLADEEEYLAEAMEIIFVQQCRFAKAQIDAGADFIGVGNAVASLVGPALYAAYALDYDRRLTEYIHGCGAKVKLHICGNTGPLLELIKEVSPDIFDIDWMVDFQGAVSRYAGCATAVNGNMDPVSVMLQGDAEAIEQAVRHCIAAAGNTTMIAAGCEIPAETPEANLLLMDKLLYRTKCEEWKGGAGR